MERPQAEKLPNKPAAKRVQFPLIDVATKTEPMPSVAPQARWLDFLAAFRAWLFLVLLLITFEAWAHTVYHTSFLLNPFNIESIAVFTVTPLLLALGQTLVIISGGI